MYIYLGMCALGLALEAMITVLTYKFIPFFLVLLVSRTLLLHPLTSTLAYLFFSISYA